MNYKFNIPEIEKEFIKMNSEIQKFHEIYKKFEDKYIKELMEKKEKEAALKLLHETRN